MARVPAMTPILAFDIETVPDCAGIRRLHGLPDDLPDAEVAEIAFQKRRTQTGNDFLGPQLHRVAVISCVLREGEGIKVFSIGEPETPEKEAIQRFFDGIEKLVPQLVSWNGGGFDLPVLHYRALLHKVASRRYWDVGDEDREFRFNNYLGRFHWRHIDLMDVIAGYQSRGRAGLDNMSLMLGFPGKMGMEGSKVWDSYREGGIVAIRNYCETDALNTYLVYLRFEHIRGHLDEAGLERELQRVRQALAGSEQAHLREFLDAWTTSES